MAGPSRHTETDLDTIGLDDVTPVTAPVGITLTMEKATLARRGQALRTLVYLMLFRVALVTLLLASVVIVALTQGSPERLAGPFGRFAFMLLTATYVASLAYGIVFRRVRDPIRFAYVQIGVDLVLITVLVHATGGAQSGFHFLYLIDIVAVALLPARNAALLVATASGLCMAGVSLAGYLEWLPLVPGQNVFPWDLEQRELLFRIVLNLAGVAAVGALGVTLSRQSREVGLRLEQHEQYAGDLASLHENIIRCLSSGLVTTTRNGFVTSINEAACDILGVSRDRALRAPLSQWIPGLEPLLEEAGPVGLVRRREVDAIRLDGSVRRLGISATPLTDHTSAVIGRVFHFQDLTDLRRMEAQVQRAERLAGIGRLAAGIAHEIRNPLASISGSVETLRTMRGGDDEDANLLTEIVVREVDRLNELISALLDYARPPTQERRPINFSELVEEVVRTFKQGHPRSQVLVAADPGIAVSGSASGLRQLLWNIIRNADEAMPKDRHDGNQIRVQLTRDELTTGEREAVLTVGDNGVGIPEDEKEHVFEPFYTRGKTGGTGLGLAMVARIVEEHAGTVDVRSQPGHGTTFEVRFPAIESNLVRPGVPSGIPSGPPG